jgi:hypothetical protein
LGALARHWVAVLRHGSENKNKKSESSSVALEGVLVIARPSTGQLNPSAPRLASHNFSILRDEYDSARCAQNALKISRNCTAGSQPYLASKAFANPDKFVF